MIHTETEGVGGREGEAGWVHVRGGGGFIVVGVVVEVDLGEGAGRGIVVFRDGGLVFGAVGVAGDF